VNMVTADRHPRITQTCERCGESFQSRSDLVKRGLGRFCSTRCAMINRYAGKPEPKKTTPGKGVPGESNVSAKITDEIVREIRVRYDKDKMTTRELAAEYGVSYMTISRVVNRQTWKHVE
jgi:hypothetical protein